MPWTKYNKIFALTTCLFLFVTGIVWIFFMLLGDQLIKAMYDGKSWELLNRIIIGQNEYPLQYYLNLGKHVMRLFSLWMLGTYCAFIFLFFAVKRFGKALLGLIFPLCIGLVIAIIVAEVFLNFSYESVNWVDPNTQFDSQLGWDCIPHRHIQHRWGSINSNSLGFRSDEIDQTKEHIVILGDSAAWGFGVGDDETMPFHLQQSFQTFNSNYQVHNSAVSGYGIGQYYLYLKKHINKFKKLKYVILVICTNNDLQETCSNVASWKRKPLFILRNGQLLLTNTPIKRFTTRNTLSMSRLVRLISRLCKPVDNFFSSLAGDITVDPEQGRKIISLLLKRIYALTSSRNAQLIVVISPEKRDFIHKSQNLIWFQGFFRSEDKPYPCLDYYESLKSHIQNRLKNLEQIYYDSCHYTNWGNQLLAETIFENIRQQHPGL